MPGLPRNCTPRRGSLYTPAENPVESGSIKTRVEQARCGDYDMALQTERPIEVQSPLGDDVLIFRRMEASEELSRLFEFEIELLSEDKAIVLEDVIGQNLTVRLNVRNDEKRFFNGYVSRFSHVGSVGRYAQYRAVLRPWLWFLTRTSDCRIFQDISVPDIIKEICGEHGFSGDIEDALQETYEPWTYCVQYRETDFNFLARLMEQEGIYYYFKHEDGKHKLVLADAHGSHEPIPGYEEVPLFSSEDADLKELDHLYEWSVEQEFQSCAYALGDFDFERPRSDMVVAASASHQHPMADLEIYDYPGDYCEPGAKAEQFAARDFTDAGKVYAGSRIHELQCRYERVTGRGNARGLYAGGLFELTECPREDQNREYLVVSVLHELEVSEYETTGSGAGTSEQTYSCRITALDSKRVFRPQRLTPKPIVQGPQTAVVTGPAGEEIWTDKYGRVKLQFPWDRYGKQDENSSCWVRVASVWAGKTWGGIQIPRIGQEVVVEFLEGDPDRPLITGRVYNGDNMPPYTLPDNQTQSGIKSRSTKTGGGANFNEFRFEDKKGEEELYLHAEKNHTNITENDRSEDVGHDRALHVGNDKSEKVDNNKKIAIGVDHDETIGSNKKLSVGANHDETIGANKTLKVAANHDESIGASMTIAIAKMLTQTVGINYAHTVGAAMELTVGAAMTETVGASKSQTIGANKNENVGKNKSTDVGSNLSEKVGANHSEAVKEAYSLTAKTVSIVAEDEISIKTGKAILLLKKDGTINIKGKDITVEGSGQITAKASKDMVLKGKKILQN
jgi:type VI secretion system secreted protein VgrG